MSASLPARAESAASARIQVSNVTVTEGNSGTTPFTAQVSLVGYYSTTPVTVRVTATSGTADGSDYSFTTTELSFTGNGPAQTVTGYVVGDTNPEGNEYFTLSASSVGSTPMYLQYGYGTVTITDDDQALASRLHVEGATVVEGNQGTTNAEVRVLLEPASSNTVTVSYQTADINAASSSDYHAVSGTLTFLPGEVLKTLSVAIIGDTLPEPDERLSIVLSNPTMALLGTSRAEVVIANDDPVVHATIADLTVDEGNDGVTVVPVTVTFDRPVPTGSKVQVGTISAGAMVDQDFRALSQTLYPPAGATEMTFDLEVLSDTVPECDEGLHIRYSTVYMGDDAPKLAKVILRNDDGEVAGCSDPFVPSSGPEPPTDGGAVSPPAVEPRPIDGGAIGVGIEAGSSSPTGPEPPMAPEPQASDAGAVREIPDTGVPPDLGTAGTPGPTSDAQPVPDAEAPPSFGDSGSAKPAGETLAAPSGCSCGLGQKTRSARFPWLALLGLLAALARVRRHFGR
jgi:MYXO-CTERM domain-containing protein